MKTASFRVNHLIILCLIISTSLLNIGTVNSQLPSFKYISSRPECQEDVCILVDFQDDQGTTDTAVLSYDGDPKDQILKGFLLDRLDPVTVIGEWEDSFDNSAPYFITIHSPQLKTVNDFYRRNDGITTTISLGNADDEIDEHEHTPDDAKYTSGEDAQIVLNSTDCIQSGVEGNCDASTILYEFPPTTMVMDLTLYYDDNILEHEEINKSKEKAERKLKHIIAKAQTYFEDGFSLKTTIKLNVVKINHVKYLSEKKPWAADGFTLIALRRRPDSQDLFNDKSHSHIFFCGINGKKANGNQVGKAKRGCVCDKNNTERIAIVAFQNGTTLGGIGLTVAHELGHNLGMQHDFKANLP